MLKSSLSRRAVAAASVAFAFSSAAQANSYAIVDLGKQDIAFGINGRGVIVGSTGKTDKAIEFRDGKWHYLESKDTEGIANAIDAHGDAVGVNGNDAAMWERFGFRTTLPMPAAASFSVALGVAADRSTVGYYIPVDDPAHDHCFLTAPGGAGQDLGMRGRGDTCVADAINGHGQIVGVANSARGGDGRAFLWQGGVFRSLGVLGGGDYSVAFAINERGHVVGTSATAPGASGLHAFVWSGGAMKDLGASDAFPSSEAFDINDSGEIVGYALDASRQRPHAARFAAGQVIPLDSEVDDLGDWRLFYANAVNAAGTIVGQGQRADGPHGFMLVPR